MIPYRKHILKIVTGAALLAGTHFQAHSAQIQDAILGQWKADEKALTIEVYKTGIEYQAKIISFTDHHSKVSSNDRLDEKNPNPALRGRKLIGLNVLHGLKYDADEKRWDDGHIYDAGSGKEYDASIELTSDGKLSVRAYKGFRILGKTMGFHR